jgi:AcrR family transcriptional regulator
MNQNAIDGLASNARKRILETAVDLFADKGYSGTSVREIVARAGVSKPVLYYYFQSKEGLFYAILEWATELQSKILNEVFENPGTMLERFIYMYHRVYLGIQQYRSLYQMIHSIIHGPPQGAPEYDFSKYQRRMFDAAKRIYAEGLSSGEVKKVGADEVAYLVLGLIDFCLNMDNVMSERADPQRPERLLRLAFEGLKERKA